MNSTKEDPFMYALIFTAAYTGMRRGELLGLRWEDVEFENRIIRVNGSKFKDTKSTSSTRPIKISENLVSLLKKHKKIQKEFQLQLEPDYENKHNLVFNKDDGTKFHPSTSSQKFKEIARKVNLDHFGLHDLRHTHAAMMLKAVVNPKIVQERLGHASISVTLDTYSHVTPDMQEKAVNKLDKLME